MDKTWTYELFTSGEDYTFAENTTIIGSCYIVCSAAGCLLNSLTILTVLKSHWIRTTPKYWLVLLVSGTFWLQASLFNPMMVAVWFGPNSENSCGMWVAAEAYNTYACVGIACWSSLLINLDYFLCIGSPPYRQRYRAPVVVVLLFLCVLSLIASLCAISLIYGSTLKPFTEVKCHFELANHIVGVIVLESTMYIPLIFSIILVLLAIVFRNSRNAQEFFELGQDLEASLDVQGYGGYRGFPPPDHVLFLLILLLCYAPATVLHHLVLDEIISPHDHPVLFHASTAAAVVRGNAGCLVPLAWYCFRDMRFTLTQLPCFRRRAHPSDSAFSESSEFRVYDSYPYCHNSVSDISVTLN